MESMPGPARLPYAPRLRRLQLKPGRALWLAKRDLSNCFYQFEVEPARLARQVVGPRLPRAWFNDLDDPRLDHTLGEERWRQRDLAARGPAPPDPSAQGQGSRQAHRNETM